MIRDYATPAMGQSQLAKQIVYGGTIFSDICYSVAMLCGSRRKKCIT